MEVHAAVSPVPPREEGGGFLWCWAVSQPQNCMQLLQLVPRAATSGLLAESPFVRAFIPVQLTIIIVFLVPHILTLIVGEKEKKIKESMQV